MQLIIAIATLVASSLAAPPNQLDSANGRIAGGSAANLELFPYVVALRGSSGWLGCAGSIIGSKWIVTAASCTNRLAGVELSVAAGTISFDSGGQEIQVQSVNQHPDFDPKTFNNDIAILELAGDLVFNEQVRSLNLPELDQAVPSGAQANITGWGRVYEGGNYPAVLLTTFVYTVSQEECRERLGDVVTDNMMCANYAAGGRGACQGDEGGPLVINKELIGIISWRRVCGDGSQPEVFARISALRQYIAEITGL